MIRPRPRAVPGTGRRPGGGAGSVMAGHSRMAARAFRATRATVAPPPEAADWVGATCEPGDRAVSRAAARPVAWIRAGAGPAARPRDPMAVHDRLLRGLSVDR